MRFAVESWAPEYGAPTGDEALAESETVVVDPWVEVQVDEWGPRTPPAATTAPGSLLFVDGVRRVEANVWITDDDAQVHRGICATYAAGAVHCDDTAKLVASEVRRGLFCPTEGAAPIETRHGAFALHVSGSDDPDALSLLLQRRMGELESGVAATVDHAEVTVVDGPLKVGQDTPGLVGFVKTHHRAYGPPIVRDTVARLAPGQRTPLLLVDTVRPRFSWYLRLPCEVAHGWAGVVRLETSADAPLIEVTALADRLAVGLPRFASVPQKDPRAPQNLYPIGGLERELRRRLGDPHLMYRALQVASRG